MDSKQFATAISELLPRVSVPASRENARAMSQLYAVLDALANGTAIIVSTDANPVPEGTDHAK